MPKYVLLTLCDKKTEKKKNEMSEPPVNQSSV
jgi:hypothetical protein